MPCLGIEIDITAGTLSLPPEKLQAAVQMYKTWTTCTRATRHQIQSLLGSPMYIHKCVKPCRLFVNRILETLRATHITCTVELTSFIVHLEMLKILVANFT